MIERKRSALALADRLVVAQQVARVQLQVLEVERRLARLRLAIRRREARQQLLQQRAVARRSLVERRLLDGLARLLVRRGALARRAEAGQVHQPVGRVSRSSSASSCVALPRWISVADGVVGEAARRLAQLLDALGELGGSDLDARSSSRPAERSVS